MNKVNIQALASMLSDIPPFLRITQQDLEILPTTGLAHDHIFIKNHPWLVRVPRQSQLALSAHDNLSYQKTCFERCAPSASTPKILETLPPCEDLPLGALIVENIPGKTITFPDHLTHVAESLALLHGLPLPDEPKRAPLINFTNPASNMLNEINTHTKYLKRAGLAPDSLSQINEELLWAHKYAIQDSGIPLCLISFDAHPGNFIFDAPRKRAILVDLEKTRYGAAGYDLAHATLYTSTTWDMTTFSILNSSQIAEFYQCWLDKTSPAFANSIKPALLPLRRIMWLWSITWCAKWRVESGKERKRSKETLRNTEDWSAENTCQVLIDHVAERTTHYLTPEIIHHVRQDWLGQNDLTALLI